MTQSAFQKLKAGNRVSWYDDQERCYIPRSVMIGWRGNLMGHPKGKVVLAPTEDYGSQDVTSPDELE